MKSNKHVSHHVGDLDGHMAAIVDGQFLGEAPFFVTVDLSNCVFIWDIRSLSCIQSVNIKLEKEQIQGIVVFSNLKFWLYGKKFYELLSTSPEIDGKKE